MTQIKLSHPTKKIKARVQIPGSKSESNRVLILNALAGGSVKLHNLSAARDTQRLVEILAGNDSTVDVLDAGTSMRFLTAYYACVNKAKIITGTERMKQRPIAPLVNALSEMGFDIRYPEKEDYPPVEIAPVKLDKTDNETFVEGDISSQFVSALLMIAPFLPNGLTINFTTELTSRPYVELTLKVLSDFGVKYKWHEQSIAVERGFTAPGEYAIGADWSAASYWYSVAFLADEAEIELPGLKDDYSQGDRVVADWMKRFGVETEFTAEGAVIRKMHSNYPKMMKMNFRDNPDLAQTFIAMFAAKNIYSTFSGIESLKIKETDRVAALRQELRKAGVLFDYSDMYEFYQLKGNFNLPAKPIQTYGDHRMAMSFAPLALLGKVEIEDGEVVEKSYPNFWEDMKAAGFTIS